MPFSEVTVTIILVPEHPDRGRECTLLYVEFFMVVGCRPGGEMMLQVVATGAADTVAPSAMELPFRSDTVKFSLVEVDAIRFTIAWLVAITNVNCLRTRILSSHLLLHVVATDKGAGVFGIVCAQAMTPTCPPGYSCSVET